MWRWSLVTAGTIALFWTIWYLINGSVPVTTQILWLAGANGDHSKDIHLESALWHFPLVGYPIRSILAEYDNPCSALDL